MPGVDRHAGEALELLVRPEQVDLDAGHHLRDGQVGDARPRLLAEAEEVQVGRVAEVEELEVVLPQLQRQVEQAVVVGLDLPAGAEAGAGLDDEVGVLELGKGVEVDGLELLDEVADLDHPLVVEVVPVHEVEPGAVHEVGDAGLDVGLRGRHRGQVGVPVEDPEVDAVGRRDLQVPGVVLGERGDRELVQRRVPRSEGLRPVDAVLEPEHGVLVLAAPLAEERRVGVQLFPALGARGRLDLERAGETIGHALSLSVVLLSRWAASSWIRPDGVAVCQFFLAFSGDMSVETMLLMKSPPVAAAACAASFLLQKVSGRACRRMTFSPSGRSQSTAHSMSCGVP